MTHHLVATAQETGDCTGIGAFFNDKHLLSCCTEGHFSNNTSRTQLIGTQVLESRDDSTVCRDSNQLDLRTTDPPNSRQLILKQEVISLIIEAPLADDEVSAGTLQVGDHLLELLLLVVLQLLELLDGGDVELMFGLGLGGFEGACEDSDLGVFDFVGHLRVGEVLVDDDALDEEGVFEGTAEFAVDFDEFEVNVLALEVGDGEDGVDCHFGELFVRLGDAVSKKGKFRIRR